MSQLRFPITKADAKKKGLNYSSDANRNALFPTRLRELRKEKDISQESLAKELQISKSTLSLYETGDTLPDAETAAKMAAFFEVSANYLLCMTDYKAIESEGILAKDLGLSEIAIETLDFYHSFEFEYPSLINVLNLIIEQEAPPPSEAMRVQDYVFLDEEEYFNDHFGVLCDTVSEESLIEFRQKKEYYSKLEEKWESVKRQTILSKMRSFLATGHSEAQCRITDKGDLIVEQEPNPRAWFDTIKGIPASQLVERVLLNDIDSAICQLKHIAFYTAPSKLQNIVRDAKNGILPINHLADEE